MRLSSEVKIVNSFSTVEYRIYEGKGALFFIFAEYAIDSEQEGTYEKFSTLIVLKYSPIMYSEIIYGFDALI